MFLPLQSVVYYGYYTRIFSDLFRSFSVNMRDSCKTRKIRFFFVLKTGYFVVNMRDACKTRKIRAVFLSWKGGHFSTFEPKTIISKPPGYTGWYKLSYPIGLMIH